MNLTAFDRAGFAALGDLRASGYDAVFELLETAQTDFNAKTSAFRDPAYAWGPGETLRTWARAWEYAYHFHHIARERARRTGPVAVADFGSGSTFFPFAVARLGTRVVALDNDPVCVRDMRGASLAVDAGPGSVEVQLSGEILPGETASFDIAYSVSVLEHMPDPVPIVAEIARIVKPGGLFVLTIDLDVEGGASGVTPQHFYALCESLRASFDWEFPERAIHPLDVLTSMNSPWPRPGEARVPGLLWRTKSRRLLPLLGGPSPGVLTVYGCVLRRHGA
ncbi:MAG: hypothetical protein NVSMB64_15200 [Candidatus Velthaea sp.]